MKIFKKTLFLLLTTLILFTSCSMEMGKTQPVYEDWKIKFADDKSYAQPDFDDSSWENSNASGIIMLKNNQHYFWLRKTITIPASLSNSEAYEYNLYIVNTTNNVDKGVRVRLYKDYHRSYCE